MVSSDDEIRELAEALLAFDEQLALEISGLARTLGDANAAEDTAVSKRRLELAETILKSRGWKMYI